MAPYPAPMGRLSRPRGWGIGLHLYRAGVGIIVVMILASPCQGKIEGRWLRCSIYRGRTIRDSNDISIIGRGSPSYRYP